MSEAKPDQSQFQDEIESLQNQISMMSKFPDQNPNPVMKMSFDGELIYANKGSRWLLKNWGIEEGMHLPSQLADHIGSKSAIHQLKYNPVANGLPFTLSLFRNELCELIRQ